jgi:hypothetical protein
MKHLQDAVDRCGWSVVFPGGELGVVEEVIVDSLWGTALLAVTGGRPGGHRLLVPLSSVTSDPPGRRLLIDG